MPTLDEIRRAFALRPPALESGVDERGERKKRAAVAMILRPGSEGPGVDVLFIERARFAGDPWSGHMAFPGGRVEDGDGDPRAAAERETLEEVGVSLHRAERLGQLDDLRGRHAGREIPMVISAYAYFVERPAPLDTNHEVAEAFWFPLAEVRDPGRRTHYEIRGLRFPGIRVGRSDGHVVWGLTYRFIENFFELLARPLPDRWQEVTELRRDSDEELERLDERLLPD